MNTSFAGHYTYGGLLKITFPSMIMLVFTSIYGVVDGFACTSISARSASLRAVPAILSAFLISP